jgi:hypothetical protein
MQLEIYFQNIAQKNKKAETIDIPTIPAYLIQ